MTGRLRGHWLVWLGCLARECWNLSPIGTTLCVFLSKGNEWLGIEQGPCLAKWFFGVTTGKYSQAGNVEYYRLLMLLLFEIFMIWVIYVRWSFPNRPMICEIERMTSFGIHYTTSCRTKVCMSPLKYQLAAKCFMHLFKTRLAQWKVLNELNLVILSSFVWWSVEKNGKRMGQTLHQITEVY